LHCYNYWHSEHTTIFYKKLLAKFNNNSKVLDVGVGPGLNLLNNKDIVIEKNLHIHGIDIDKQYNDYCKSQVKNQKLGKYFKIELLI
jgi:ubiquinone/menaquinone biosynthesis C-methylase UbiE